MGAIYGVVGESDATELTDIGARLRHRGSEVREWSPGAGCRLGERSAHAPARDVPPSIAFDGYIDNVEEVTQLVGGGDLDATAADPRRLLAALFSKLGPVGARHLEGHFAIAFWDDDAGRLVLIRDRYGASPLYSVRSRGRLLFASEYKALLAIPDMPAEPNRVAMRHLQCTRYPMLDQTLLAGVHPVARSAWTTLEPEAESVRRYWTPRTAVARRSDAEHVAALRRALLEATRRQVARFDPIGVQLSGGLDSAMVLGGIREVAPECAVHTFTAGYGADDPEIEAAGRLARHFETVHHPLVLEPERIPELLPATVWHMEDVYGREEMVQLYVLTREAARHVEMLLAGYAADMLLGGMPRHRLAHLAMRWPWSRGPLADFYRTTQTGLRPRSLAGRALVRLHYRGKHVDPPRVLGTAYEPESDPLRREGDQPLGTFLAHGVHEDLGWEAIQGCHAAWGIDFNAPFMSPRFAECAFTIPDHLKIRGRTQKAVLRRVGAGLLPAEVLQRGKTFQRLRHDERFSAVLERLADEFLNPASLRDRGLFDPGEVDALRRRRSAAPYPTEQAYRLWTLIESELWCRLFVDRRGRPLDRPA